MLRTSISMAQFTSKSSSAGIVNVMFGFVPDFAILIQDFDGTNPNIHLWANVSQFPLWATALSLLITGSTGVVTRETSGITAYAGNDVYPAGATVNDATLYLDEQGAIESFTTTGDDTVGPTTTGPLAMKPEALTKAGLTIPAALQTASGKNLVIAFRRNE